jgi:hypothetical protein
MSNRPPTEVLLHFKRVEPHFADCLTCNAHYKCLGLTTSSLRNHLLSHNIVLANIKAPSEPSTSTPTTAKIKPKTNQPSVLDDLQKGSIRELLAKCAADDGFSISAITKSTAIREFITKRVYKMPRSRMTMRKL